MNIWSNRLGLDGKFANHHKPDFCHILNGISDPLPAKATVFYAAIGHLVGSPWGDVAYDDSADIKFFPGELGSVEVPCENTGLQAERTVVYLFQGLGIVTKPGKYSDRAKGFFYADRAYCFIQNQVFRSVW